MTKIVFYVWLNIYSMFNKKIDFEQKGLLKRFSINCYGKQDTLEEMRNTKALKYKELKGISEIQKNMNLGFLRYIPFEETFR